MCIRDSFIMFPLYTVARVCFYLSYQTRSKTIGIEYDERIYQGAAENKETAVFGNRTSFILSSAENYELPPEVNRCYFFNPFSLEILHSVLARIYAVSYTHLDVYKRQTLYRSSQNQYRICRTKLHHSGRKLLQRSVIHAS